MMVKDFIEHLKTFDPESEIAGFAPDGQVAPLHAAYQATALHREQIRGRDAIDLPILRTVYRWNGPSNEKVVVISFE